MPQIIDKNKRFSKDLLISRLEVIDKLNNRQVEDYSKFTDDLKKT